MIRCIFWQHVSIKRVTARKPTLCYKAKGVLLLYVAFCLQNVAWTWISMFVSPVFPALCEYNSTSTECMKTSLEPIVIH